MNYKHRIKLLFGENICFEIIFNSKNILRLVAQLSNNDSTLNIHKKLYIYNFILSKLIE